MGLLMDGSGLAKETGSIWIWIRNTALQEGMNGASQTESCLPQMETFKL